MQVEQQIIDAGAEIIWVLEASGFGQPGTAAECRDFLDSHGSTQGWCVGDGETMPTPGTWDDSPFGLTRGFDIVVPRRSMEIVYSTNHGTGSGFDNITGEELLVEIQAIAAGL